jgi:hypothetical protein
MVLIGQITTSLSSPVVQVAIVVAGCLVLFMVFKVGYFILKMALGLVGLALLGGAISWFFFRN